MTNLIRNILKTVFVFCVITAFSLTMYGTIILIAMNYIAHAIVIFIIIAVAIYLYMNFTNETRSQLDLMKSALENYSDHNLDVMQEIVKRGLRKNRFDANIIEVDTESIRGVLRYYLNSVN